MAHRHTTIHLSPDHVRSHGFPVRRAQLLPRVTYDVEQAVERGDAATVFRLEVRPGADAVPIRAHLVALQRLHPSIRIVVEVLYQKTLAPLSPKTLGRDFARAVPCVVRER